MISLETKTICGLVHWPCQEGRAGCKVTHFSRVSASLRSTGTPIRVPRSELSSKRQMNVDFNHWRIGQSSAVCWLTLGLGSMFFFFLCFFLFLGVKWIWISTTKPQGAKMGKNVSQEQACCLLALIPNYVATRTSGEQQL